MPWPVREDDNEQEDVDYDTWLLNDLDFPWLLESDGWFVAFSISFLCEIKLLVAVKQIIAKAMNGEIWITSDGRAYLVSLQGNSGPENDSSTENRFSEVMYLPFLNKIYIRLSFSSGC